MLLTTTNDNIQEELMGTIQDCKELYEITISSLNDSLVQLTATTSSSNELTDISSLLAAAATNTDTCLEELEFTSGPLKPVLNDSINAAYEPLLNSLSLLSDENPYAITMSTKGVDWLSEQKDTNTVNYVNTLTVAKDGSGNFTTITDAIDFAPNDSVGKVIIYVKAGLYEEYVVIPKSKPNIVLRGEGKDVTKISGSRNMIDRWATYRSATLCVSGKGFMARDIAFHNVAGPEKEQAVALRVNSQYSAFYRCTISGYQDTLYAHSFTQFYRECDIYGTIDFIFGNAAAVFQKCNIITRMPMPDQHITVITAQSRKHLITKTGMAFKNCHISASKELLESSPGLVKSYLGRPWRSHARVVFIESYLDGFIDPEGWVSWPNMGGLDTVYYGEYENSGPGSGLNGRVNWPGHHVMDSNEASTFKVSNFILGQHWLVAASVPYDDN
ncbi:pectinesterase, active site-containing protein [Tanacetum coccineum]